MDELLAIRESRHLRQNVFLFDRTKIARLLCFPQPDCNDFRVTERQMLEVEALDSVDFDGVKAHSAEARLQVFLQLQRCQPIEQILLERDVLVDDACDCGTLLAAAVQLDGKYFLSRHYLRLSQHFLLINKNQRTFDTHLCSRLKLLTRI